MSRFASALPSAEPLVVKDIRLAEDPSWATLSGRLETPGIPSPPTVWFQFPARLASGIATNGDPFFPPLLLAAMAHGRRLVIEADVSAALLAAAPRVMENHQGRPAASGRRFQRVEVTAQPVARTDRGGTAGQFLSCGVDSVYTLLRNVARYPEGDSRSVSHLVLVHGFDIPLEHESFFQTVKDQADVLAQALRKTLVPVRTNVREVVRDLDWAGHGVGPAAASVGLALGRLLHTVFIASGAAFGELRPDATGCHPGLDPLWSTETLEFVHDGAEAKKAEKIAVIASSPPGLRVLRVCWENRGGAYNCGRCTKCLNTMVLLDLYGVLGQAGQFPPTYDCHDIAVLDLAVGTFRRTLWRETLARVQAAGGRPELVDAIESALARGAWAASRLGRADARASEALARVGLTPARVRWLDRTLLGGLGVRLFRASVRGARGG